MRVRERKKCWEEFLKKFPQPETGMNNPQVEAMIDHAFDIAFTIKEKK